MVSVDPNCRPSHFPLISGDTFRASCRFVIDETGIAFDTEKVERGDTVFVGMSYLNYFLKEILPHLNVPIVLVTSNGEGTVDDRYLDVLELAQIGAWFGRNMTLIHPKARCIPLGVCWNQMPNDRRYHEILKIALDQLTVEDFFKPKQTAIYLNIWRPSHPIREQVYRHFSNLAECKVVQRRLQFREYFQDLANARFVISPRGVNIDCYRTWEALIAGSIPVVESEGIDGLYEGLPVIIAQNLTSVTNEFLNEEFEKMRKQNYNLAKLRADFWLAKIKKKSMYLKENIP